MANISAKDVMELRKKTGCGMMECKKALVETEGNFDEAIKYLREKGLSVAAKKAVSTLRTPGTSGGCARPRSVTPAPGMQVSATPWPRAGAELTEEGVP